MLQQLIPVQMISISITLILILIIFIYMLRQLKTIREKQTLQIQVRETVLQSKLEIQEQTLNMMSKQIHDNIGQVLSLVKLNLATMNLQNAETLQQELEYSKQLLGKAISDLRQVTKGLKTSFITEMGLLRSIEYELDMAHKSGGFTTLLNTWGTPVRLDDQKELIVFRIIQEVFNNVIKHAGASELLTQINFLPDVLTITITDNGKGFDVTNENIIFGLGLRNMQNRAQLVGAELKLTSIPRKGTTVTLSLPFSST
jgi:two-component system NarL family sensor kinase